MTLFGDIIKAKEILMKAQEDCIDDCGLARVVLTKEEMWILGVKPGCNYSRGVFVYKANRPLLDFNLEGDLDGN